MVTVINAKNAVLCCVIFFNQLEAQKIDRLCTAAETDEKLFWKLLKGQRNSSQMHAFLVEGKLLSDVDKIHNMWASHFEALGTPFASSNFDNDFYDRVLHVCRYFY